MPASSEDIEDEDSENSSLCSSDSGGHVGLHQQAVQMFQELAYPVQEKQKALVKKTELHVELPDDLLQATFELMKRVVLAPPCCRPLTKLCCGDAQDPTVEDFQRAYALVHDWFPEHPTEPGCASRWMWYESRAEMLQALLQLAEMEVLPGQDKCTDFAEWVEGEIKRAQPQGEEMQYMSRRRTQQWDGSVPNVEQATQEQPPYWRRRSHSRDWGRVVLNGMEDEARLLTSVRTRQLQGVAPLARGEKELRELAHHNLLAMHALLCQSATRVHLSWWQKVFKSMHIIYIILMMNAFAIFEAGFIGLIVQFFLDINIVHVSEFVFTEWRMVVMAPIFLTFGAFLGHEIFDLAGDTINRPPFSKCRAHMMVTLEVLVHGKDKMLRQGLSIWSVKGLDFLFTWALVLPCLVGAISVGWVQDILETFGLSAGASEMQSIGERGWMNSQMHYAAIAGLCWCVFIWFTFMFCKLFNYLISYSRMSFLDGERSFPVLAVVRVIQDNLVCYNIFPGFSERYFMTIKRHMAAHGSDHLQWTLAKISDWVERWDDWKAYSDHISRVDPGLHISRLRKGLGLGLAGLVLWPVLYFTCIWGVLGTLRALNVLNPHWVHVVSIWSCGLLINAAAYCIATATYRFLPRLNSSPFRGHMMLFQLLNLFLMVLSTGHNKFLEGTPDLVMHAKSTPGAFYNSPDMDGMGHTITPYPVCSMRWGREVERGSEDGRLNDGRLSALDLAVLSSYSYAANRTLFTSLVQSSFGSNVEVLEVSQFHAIPRTVMVRFPARDYMAGTIVVAVKGTSTMEEAFADMGLYTNMAMLQLLDKVLPILHTFPVSVIAAAIGHLTMPFSGKVSKKFLGELKKSVIGIRKAHPNHSIVLTGHSLGGGFAEVAAAQLSVPGLVFSAPGNLFVTKELQVPKKDVYRNVVGIMPDDDVVPRVDEHVDMYQRIECRDKHGVPRDAFTCHRILVSICELWRVCGDVQRRDFAPTCVGEGLVDQACEKSQCF